MIRALRVKGYKSLADCSIELAPVSVILGPNAAGKSNLLDLIGLLSRLVSSETIRDAFEGHRGRPLESFHSPDGFGQGTYERIADSDRMTFEVECDLELHARIIEDVNRALAQREEAVGAAAAYTRVSERLLRYRLVIGFHPGSGELFVVDEKLQALKSDLEPKAPSVRKPFVDREPGQDGRQRFVARVEKQSHPRYFDVARPRTLLSELSDPVYHPHVVAAAREIASWRVYYVEPARMREAVGVQAADEPGRSGELLPAYYFTLQQRHPTSLKGIIRNLRELVPGIEGLHVEVKDGLLELVTRHEGGAEYPARLLSEGTLRLLCIIGLSVSPRPPAVVVYEEPENGVNPARLDLIAQIIKDSSRRENGSQFILTTHSPLLCHTLPEHLIVCSWSRNAGSRFETFPWERDTMYFESEVVRALDRAASLEAVAETGESYDAGEP